MSRKPWAANADLADPVVFLQASVPYGLRKSRTIADRFSKPVKVASSSAVVLCEFHLQPFVVAANRLYSVRIQ